MSHDPLESRLLSQESLLKSLESHAGSHRLSQKSDDCQRNPATETLSKAHVVIDQLRLSDTRHQMPCSYVIYSLVEKKETIFIPC